MDHGELAARTSELRAARTPYVLATVVRVERPTSAKPSDVALILPDGTFEGFVGGSCAESTVRLQSLRLLNSGGSTLLRITPGAEDEQVAAGLVTVANPCLSGGTMDIFLEAELPPPLVHILGDAPIARAVARLGECLGYQAYEAALDTPIAPDTTAVLVATHGRDEGKALGTALAAGVPYVGLVASERRSAAVLAALDASDDEKARVHTPAGLAIGARTPDEVALSILAEIVADRRPSAELSGSDTAMAPSGPDKSPGIAVTDPVCGMRVAAAESSVHVERDGRTWYFCGSGCRQAFTDDPARYAS